MDGAEKVARMMGEAVGEHNIRISMAMINMRLVRNRPILEHRAVCQKGVRS